MSKLLDQFKTKNKHHSNSRFSKSIQITENKKIKTTHSTYIHRKHISKTSILQIRQCTTDLSDILPGLLTERVWVYIKVMFGPYVQFLQHNKTLILWKNIWCEVTSFRINNEYQINYSNQ